MSVSNKTNYMKNKEYWKIYNNNNNNNNNDKKPVSCHTYSILFAIIFNAILFKKLT